MTVDTTPDTARTPGIARTRRGGPPLPAPILAWAVLTIGATVTYPGIRPGQDPVTVLHGVQGTPTAAVSALLLVASAVPLLVWAAATHHRFSVLGVRVAGPTIGLVGGVLAATALAVSGLAGWTAASVAPDGDAALVGGLTRLGFAAGGPLFAAGLGLAIAGTAVPTLILRLVPRPLAIAGLVLAGFGAVGLLVLVVPVLGPVLPVVRFGGLIWLVTVGFVLPVTRTRAAR